MPEIRVGAGHDLHRLEPGHRLVLAGVEIPAERGAVGHSDADVVLHAVTDAILGAAALGDIGRLFPNTDPAYRDADSGLFLTEAVRLAVRRSLRQSVGKRPVTKVHVVRV